MDLKAMLTWTFSIECPIPDDVQNILVEGEKAVCAYKTIRDVAIFTNKRLIVRDAQGLSGKKVEIYSLPYTSINMWSTENAGKYHYHRKKSGSSNTSSSKKLHLQEVCILATALKQ